LGWSWLLINANRLISLVKVLVLASGANNSNFFGSQAGNSATMLIVQISWVKMLVQTQQLK
jgi:hypothetical protein